MPGAEGGKLGSAGQSDPGTALTVSGDEIAGMGGRAEGIDQWSHFVLAFFCKIRADMGPQG